VFVSCRRSGRYGIRGDALRSKDAPLVRLMQRASLSRMDVAYRSRVSLPTIDKMCRDDGYILKMQMGTLLKVSMALGCALAELYPVLAQRPSKGLLWERRVYVAKRSKVAFSKRAGMAQAE